MDIIRLYSVFKDFQQKDLVRLTKQAFWDGKKWGIWWDVHIYIYLSIYLSISLSLYLSIYLPLNLSIARYLSIYPSIYLSIWAGCVLQQLKVRYMINFNKQSMNPMDEDKDWLNWLIIGS